MLLKLLIFLVSVCKPYCTITFLIFNPKKLRNTSHFVKKLNFSSFPFPTTLAPFDCTLKNPTTVRILILDIRFLCCCQTVFLMLCIIFDFKTLFSKKGQLGNKKDYVLAILSIFMICMRLGNTELIIFYRFPGSLCTNPVYANLTQTLRFQNRFQ
jgi:hypothetical protein